MLKKRSIILLILRELVVGANKLLKGKKVALEYKPFLRVKKESV